MSFMDKMKNLVGIEDEYDDDELEITQEEIDSYKRQMKESAPAPAPQASSSPVTHIEGPLKTGISPLAFNDSTSMSSMSSMSAPTPDAKASINQAEPFKMVVIEPKNIDECRKLIDNLRQRKPVIINLENVETGLAHKMFDFLSGATYALSGTVQRISQNIYLFAPNNVNIKAMVDRATEAGKPANSNPWK